MLYDNLTVNDKGHLAVGGMDAAELASEYGTPLYVMDEDVLREGSHVVGFQKEDVVAEV